jgi:hypothetical protein
MFVCVKDGRENPFVELAEQKIVTYSLTLFGSRPKNKKLQKPDLPRRRTDRNFYDNKKLR